MDALKVADELDNAIRISRQAKSARTLDDLRALEREANRLDYGSDYALGEINNRIDVLEREEEIRLARENEKIRREQERLEREERLEVERQEKELLRRQEREEQARLARSEKARLRSEGIEPDFQSKRQRRGQ